MDLNFMRPPWNRGKGVSAVVSRFKEIGCFMEEGDELLGREIIESLAPLYEKDCTRFWFDMCWSGSLSNTSLLSNGIAELKLPPSVAVTSMEFGHSLLNAGLENKPSEYVERVLPSLLTTLDSNGTTLLVPVCNINHTHWGLIVVVFDDNTGQRGGTVYFGHSLHSSPFTCHSGSSCLRAMKSALCYLRPLSVWKTSSVNYILSNKFMGFKRQMDAFSCGFYMLCVVASFASERGCLPTGDYSDYSSIALTESHRRACCIAAFRNSKVVWKNLASYSTRRRNMFEQNLRLHISTVWPSKMAKRDAPIPSQTISDSPDKNPQPALHSRVPSKAISVSQSTPKPTPNPQTSPEVHRLTRNPGSPTHGRLQLSITSLPALKSAVVSNVENIQSSGTLAAFGRDTIAPSLATDQFLSKSPSPGSRSVFDLPFLNFDTTSDCDGVPQPGVPYILPNSPAGPVPTIRPLQRLAAGTSILAGPSSAPLATPASTTPNASELSPPIAAVINPLCFFFCRGGA